jgi:glycerate-2-kinase
MRVIKNYDSLAQTPARKTVLELIETAFAAIQPENVLNTHFTLKGTHLHILDQNFDLANTERVFLLGFGKGSMEVCRIISDKLGEKLTSGFDIDVVEGESFGKISYTKGSHPLPIQTNVDFTRNALSQLQNLSENDLVLVVICGGGSALFEDPNVELETLAKINKALLESGATISEINVIRKHLSKVKGGGLAKLLFPAKVVSLIFSDVPGNDLSVIASGPTVMNTTTKEDVKMIMEKYDLSAKAPVQEDNFIDTPSDESYFKNTTNILVLSNMTALLAMQEKAKELGYKASITTDKLQGDARSLGAKLIEEAKPGEITLCGGESTVKITGSGKGGRNQALVLSSLPSIKDDTLIVAFDSDGWDFYGYAGAMGDSLTLEKAKTENLEIDSYLKDDNSFAFFQKTGDGIDTGKLESNVSDLFIVCKI